MDDEWALVKAGRHTVADYLIEDKGGTLKALREEALRLLPEIADVYGAAFAAPPYSRTEADVANFASGGVTIFIAAIDE